MMSAADVLAQLDLVAAAAGGAKGNAAPRVWIDGGWGVDALLERQTRPHDDLDLVVESAAVPAIRAALLDAGFVVERDWRPVTFAVRHPDGHAVDLHPIEPTPDGGGDQTLPDGTRWHYGPPVVGLIAGCRVPCCSLDTQLAAHLGYEPDDNDRADMAALARRFGCVLTGPYAAGS